MAAPEVAPMSYPNNKPPNAGNRNLGIQERKNFNNMNN